MNRSYIVSLVCTVFFLLISSCTKPLNQLVEEREILAVQDSEWLDDRLGDLKQIELTVDEAVVFALNHNLQLPVLEADLKVQADGILSEMIRMLPNLTYTSFNAVRNNLLIESSTSVLPQIPPAPASFSSLKVTDTWTWELSWDLLNAGIQYFRVKEAKNATLAKEFTYQRTAQDLIRQVVSTYWIAAVLQSDAEKLDELTVISKDLAERLKSKVDEGILPLQQATEVIGRIYYQQIQAKQYLRPYWDAKESIKNLLGLPPHVKVVFKIPEEHILPAPLPPPEELYLLALEHRPDLYNLDVQLAIHQDELKQAILSMFPELTPFVDFSYDGNPFMKFSYWSNCGFRSLFSLLNIPLSLNAQLTAKDQMRLICAQRVFLSLTVLSQIHIAYALYEDARSRYLDAQIYWMAKKNNYDLALAKKNLNAIADLDYVFPLSDLAYADAQKNLFYVEMMGYLEQINNSIGIPRYFTENYKFQEFTAEEPQECI